MASGGSGEENPCLKAIEAVKKGGKATKGEQKKKGKGILEKATDGIGGALKSLFTH